MPVSNQLILACHITGIYDVNRNNVLKDDDYGLVKEWAESVRVLGLSGVIFHNNFSKSTVQKYQNECIEFVEIEHDRQFNPNVYRYLVYQDYLNKYNKGIKSLFVTDVSDVVVVKNPFEDALFKNDTNILFCGDEPKILDNDWMKNHSEYLRNQIADYADYEEQFKNETLLNCGIIGGSIHVMQELIEKLSQTHRHYNSNNQTAYTGDMGAFNYIARTQFNDRLHHGLPCNTVFKEYQTERQDCWFRHK